MLNVLCKISNIGRLTVVRGWMLGILLTSCTRPPAPMVDEARAAEPVNDATALVILDRIAESYVQLVLALGEHDPDYVDAYYGPGDRALLAQSGPPQLDDLRKQAESYLSQLAREPTLPDNEILRLRYDYLTTQLRSLVARVEFVGGKRLSFDEESAAFYDATAPTKKRRDFQRVLNRLNDVLPGRGSIQSRAHEYRSRFIVSPDRLESVFAAAIDACRSRTSAHIELPEDENFTVEYVTDKPWSGYNWYQGNFRSIIQVNVHLPVYIDRALDLACHEGYPGHHVYNVLLEKHLVRDRGWPEYTVYPLFSPQSLIAEGSANYGIEVAFSKENRITFERDTLFPLAGLDGSEAERYLGVMQLLEELNYAGNEAARGYLDGDMSRAEAVDWLVEFNLMTPERASQRVDFFERYRSYVINYNLGQDLVREYVERGLDDDADDEVRWERFGQLISSPRLPSSLRPD